MDYAHCRGCDVVLNLDKDKWYSDGNDTFCESCWDEEMEKVLENMDVPEKRRGDKAWLVRNLGIRNGDHPKFQLVLDWAKESLENAAGDAKLDLDKIFEEYVEEHPIEVYVDYRDELSNDQVNKILEGKKDEVRWEIEDNASMYCDIDEDHYYWTEMADELGVELEQIKNWLQEDGFHPSYYLTERDFDRLMDNTTCYITAIVWDAEYNFNNWAYGEPIEYRGFRETFRYLGVNPAEFKALKTGGSATMGDGKFKGYFPNIEREPKIDIKELYDNMCVLYDGVMTFCLGSLSEVAEVLEKNPKKIQFRAGTNVVMYHYGGGAGITEVQLKDHVVIPRNKIEFRNDGDSKYGVQACYGFVDSYWKEGEICAL